MKRSKNLWRYVGIRFVGLIPLLLVVSTLVFILLRMAPGDPAVLMLGADATPEAIIEVREKLGLDQPFHIQLGSFLINLTRGDLGRSYQTGRPVTAEIGRTLPVTITLSAIAIVLASVVGILVGVISAVKQYSWMDNVFRIIVLAGVSMPVFWLGLMLMVVFAGWLGWLPSSGWGTWKHMVLPSTTLATFPLAIITRITRSSMLEVIRQDYIRTARAKGLSQSSVVLRHALRNALIPVVTVIGLQFGVLLAGAVLAETVFAIPGLGRLTVTAVFARDYPLIRGAVLLAAALFMFINLTVDVLYTFLNPRIRY